MKRLPDEATVLLRWRPARPTQGVEVRGEVATWKEGLVMRPAGGGWFEASISLPAGCYAYKFRTCEGSWHADPSNPRTCGPEGATNSLLCVHGADEPIVHAPCRPDVFVQDDGRLRIGARLRKSAGNSLRIRWDEGHGWNDWPMECLGNHHEHGMFVVHLPITAPEFRYVFVLPDGRCIGAMGGGAQAFHVCRSDVRCDAPAWWKEAVLYTILVDRFRQGGRGGTWAQTPEPLGPRRAGGDLEGIREALPYLADLGVTALHLTPLHLAPSAHRYDVVDPRCLDPLLGGDEALRHLLDAAHGLGLRIVTDLTVTHVHRDFAPFRDVAARGPQSRWWEWFYAYRFPFSQSMDPGYRHYQKKQWFEPLLRLDHPEVQDFVCDTFAHWAGLGVDAFRIDAASDVPLTLQRRIGATVRAVNRDALLFGEVIPDHLWRYTREALHSGTDFVLQEGLYDWLVRRRIRGPDLSDIQTQREFGRGGPNWTAVAFAGTHDQPRFASLVRDLRIVRLAHLLILLRPEIPALYYGDELGLSSQDPSAAFEDAWPDRMRMPWAPHAWDGATRALVREAIRLRRQRPALHSGDCESLTPVDSSDSTWPCDVAAFRRTAGEEVIEVFLNGGDDTVNLPLPTDAPSAATPLLALEDAMIEGNTVRLGPWSAIVVARHPRPEVIDGWRMGLAENRRRSDAAFARGCTETLSLPAHLYLTVTERCNLRCRHCITHAPQRTRDRTAREMPPWLLDRLEGAFEAASYFGFSHGGESLVSRAFLPLLDAIVSAKKRVGGAYDVHLLTNGMLLDEARLGTLVDRHVTSLAVSLDGTSARTNDHIRMGSQVGQVTTNLARAVRLREATGADLRIGVSMVACVTNLGELADMGRLVADLGLDWLKIEEMFPCNAFARDEFLPPTDPRLLEAMAELRVIADRSGFVLVDHLAAPDACDCDVSSHAPLRRFRTADNFANRAFFKPCRMAWEQACIDPDGTVHLTNYDQPKLGNLLQMPLLALWNGRPAQSARREFLRHFNGARRETCPMTAALS